MRESEKVEIELGCKNDIISLFEDYIQYMRQFVEVEDPQSWLRITLGYLDSYATDKERGYAVAEFYIDGNHEASGLGRRLAEFVFSQYPGQWEVAVMTGNEKARSFWGTLFQNISVTSVKHLKLIRMKAWYFHLIMLSPLQ